MSVPVSSPAVPPTRGGYSPAVLEALRAVRAFGAANDRMASAMKGDMDMNATDLAALRFLIMKEETATPVSQHEIARHLRVSTASTTKMLDRLTESGHVRREQHPTDRRARTVVLTQKSREDFWKLFGQRLGRMAAVASTYTDEELFAASRLINELSAVIGDE